MTTLAYSTLFINIAEAVGKVTPTPIGCIVLASPFFFDEEKWISAPEDWKANIVQGKCYDTDSLIGERLYNRVRDRLEVIEHKNGYEDSTRYGSEQIIRPRIGQGAFKVLVT